MYPWQTLSHSSMIPQLLDTFGPLGSETVASYPFTDESASANVTFHRRHQQCFCANAYR